MYKATCVPEAQGKAAEPQGRHLLDRAYATPAPAHHPELYQLPCFTLDLKLRGPSRRILKTQGCLPITFRGSGPSTGSAPTLWPHKHLSFHDRPPSVCRDPSVRDTPANGVHFRAGLHPVCSRSDARGVPTRGLPSAGRGSEGLMGLRTRPGSPE